MESEDFKNMTEEEINSFVEEMEQVYAYEIVEKSWPLTDFLSKYKNFKDVSFCSEFYSVTEDLEDVIVLRDNTNTKTIIFNLSHFSKEEIMRHTVNFIVERRKSGHLILTHKVSKITHGIYLIQKNNLWGCADDKGNVIIPIKYDTIDISICDSEKIVCGRNGKQYNGYVSYSYFFKEDISFDTIYTGVYDLYDTKGKLLLGGFIDYKYIEKCKMYLFKYGHNYKYYEGEGTKRSPYICKKPYGEWIFLNSHFCFANGICVDGSVLEYKGDCLQGYVKHKDKPEENLEIKDVLYSNIELKNSTTILCKRGRGCVSSYCIYNIKEASFSLSYKWIDILDSTYSFVYQHEQIGLLKNNIAVIPCKCSYITNPIDGWCFAAIKYPYTPNSDTWGKFYVILCNINENRYDAIPYKQIIVAIDNIDEESLRDLLASGGLMLYKKDSNRKFSSFTISQQFKSFFRIDFLKMLNTPFYEKTFEPKCYWQSATAYKIMLEKKYKVNSFHDSYTLMDALDGDLSAHWNID